VFERILGIILPVFVIVLVGYFYARRVKPDMAAVNQISMTILAPALIFSALASKDFSIGASGPLMLGAIGIVLGSGLLAWPVARVLHVDYRTFVPPMMFNNCGNMGVPLAVLAAGQQGLSMMVILFTTSNLLHFTLGTWIVRHKVGWHDVLLNPMVVATVAGATAGLLHPVMQKRITGSELGMWLGLSESMALLCGGLNHTRRLQE
jgi:predicted permease